MKAENESQILDEYDQSMNLEDLNGEYRILSELLEKAKAKIWELTQQIFEMNEALTQMQAMCATIPMHQQELLVLKNATDIISNDILESVIPPARDMGVDPFSLDNTTMGISDTLPIYLADDNGLLEGNPCTKDTKDEQITSPPYFLNKLRIEKSIYQCRVGS